MSERGDTIRFEAIERQVEEGKKLLRQAINGGAGHNWPNDVRDYLTKDVLHFMPPMMLSPGDRLERKLLTGSINLRFIYEVVFVEPGGLDVWIKYEETAIAPRGNTPFRVQTRDFLLVPKDGEAPGAE